MTAISQHLAGATATIDLAALKANYLLLARKAKTATTAAAIKGDAYGLGVKPVAKTLWGAGCRSFYVARPDEGATLRAILPRATITVLDGLYQGEAKFYRKHGLVPALTTLSQLHEWAKNEKGDACVLHVDTGINRAGLQPSEWLAFTGDEEIYQAVMVGRNSVVRGRMVVSAHVQAHRRSVRYRVLLASWLGAT